MSITAGSLFAGAGGLDLGVEDAGVEVRWQCEIDPAARSVLRRHWPSVTLHGDVRDVAGAAVEPVDVIVGGSPCTNLSLAGNRRGLAGEESGLFREMVRIVAEMRAATGGRYPRMVLWENVEGAFSTNGGLDFAEVVASWVRLGASSVDWRLLDGRGFGVPQRRRRVLMVARFDGATEAVLLGGAGHEHPNCPPLLNVLEAHPPSEMLLSPKACRGVLQRCERRGNRVPAPLDAALRFVAALSDKQYAELCAQWDAGTLDHRILDPDVARCLNTHQKRLDATVETWPVHVVGFAENQLAEVVLTPDYIQKLAVGGGKPGQGYPAIIAFDWQASAGNDTSWRWAGRQWIVRRLDGVGALQANKVEAIIGFNSYQDLVPTHDASPTVTAVGGIGVLLSLARRLTPVECERLMGWPDGHTATGDDGRPLPKTARYRLCGNGVIRGMGAWAARRMVAAVASASSVSVAERDARAEVILAELRRSAGIPNGSGHWTPRRGAVAALASPYPCDCGDRCRFAAPSLFDLSAT